MAETRGLKTHESGVVFFERWTPTRQTHSSGSVYGCVAAAGARGGGREGRPSQSEKTGNDAASRPLIARALENVRRLDGTVSGSLRVARSGRSPRRRLDLGPVVGAAAQSAESTFAEHGATDAVITSQVAYAESCSALARRKRDKRLTGEEFQKARKNLDEVWPQMDSIVVDELRAGELAIKHVIRGFDAIHLAAALEIRASATENIEVRFCSFDDRQNEAARAEAFSVIEL